MTIYREPIQFTAGDSLSFTRTLCDYPATAGWSLTYELRGGNQPITFASTANVADHVIFVLPITTSLWLPGEYLLVGYAVLPIIAGANPQRVQIYSGQMLLLPNLVGSAADVPVKTFKQKVLEAAECAYLEAIANNIKESDVEGTKIVRELRKQTQEAYAIAYQDRQNEIAGERSRAGLPTGQKIKPRMMIKNLGMFPWQGRGIGNLT